MGTWRTFLSHEVWVYLLKSSTKFNSQEATRLQPKMVGKCAIGELQHLKKKKGWKSQS